MSVERDRRFDALVTRYRHALTGAAYHLCGNRETALDLVQETLLDAYRGLPGLRDEEKTAAWLYAILRRKALRQRQHRQRECALTTELAAPAPDDTETLVREIVIEQMAKLEREERELLAGKYLFGLSYQELAAALGVSEGAVRVRCFRAREKLREVLSGAGVQVPRKGLTGESHEL